MIGPALTALLSNTAREALGDFSPVFGALLDHNSGQDLILLPSPGDICYCVAVTKFKPALVAFDFRLPRK